MLLASHVGGLVAGAADVAVVGGAVLGGEQALVVDLEALHPAVGLALAAEHVGGLGVDGLLLGEAVVGGGLAGGGVGGEEDRAEGQDAMREDRSV